MTYDDKMRKGLLNQKNMTKHFITSAKARKINGEKYSDRKNSIIENHFLYRFGNHKFGIYRK